MSPALSGVFLPLVIHLAKRKLALNNEFGKVANDKINTQKSVAFLYTKTKGQKEKSNKQSHLPSHLKE